AVSPEIAPLLTRPATTSQYACGLKHDWNASRRVVLTLTRPVLLSMLATPTVDSTQVTLAVSNCRNVGAKFSLSMSFFKASIWSSAAQVAVSQKLLRIRTVLKVAWCTFTLTSPPG